MLRAQDDEHRLIYSLAATFLGRMCLSGDLHDLSAAQWELTLRAMEFYGQVAPLIKRGETRFHGPPVTSYRHPKGWQAVVRMGESDNEALVVVHCFAGENPGVITVPLPGEGRWTMTGSLSPAGSSSQVDGSALVVELAMEFSAGVFHLSRLDSSLKALDGVITMHSLGFGRKSGLAALC